MIPNNHIKDENILSRLENAYECSISGVFQELLSKGFKSSSPTSTTSTNIETLKFGDSEGSDFKRLLHKKDKNTEFKASMAVTTSFTNMTTTTLERKSSTASTTSSLNSRRHYHQDSPDFRPAIHLESPTPSPSTSRTVKFGKTFYSFFFQHEDGYFISDRDELSKDIFPVGQAH